jgi:hypothetical protein
MVQQFIYSNDLKATDWKLMCHALLFTSSLEVFTGVSPNKKNQCGFNLRIPLK